MTSYLARRFAVTICSVLVATLLAFVLMRLVPGEPARIVLTRVFGQDQTIAVSQGDVDAVARRFGLDAPLIVQYGRWIGGVLRGDFGNSIRTGRPVATELRWRLSATALLAALSTLCSLVLAFVLVASVWLSRQSWTRHVAEVVAVGSIAIPAFYLGVALIILLSLWLDLLPVSGFQSWAHVVLPVCVLALGQFGFNIAILLGLLDEVYAAPYILTARAKGLTTRQVLVHHALRNALVPFIPYLALEIAFLVGGVLVVERLFGVPGIGSYLLESLDTHDIPAFLGTVGVIAGMVALCNFSADILVALLDPRVRLAGEQI